MSNEKMTRMVDAAMVEMANIHPPLRRSECERLISAALSSQSRLEQPDWTDPMDWPLPCDVSVGHVTIRGGCRLRVLVDRMQVLYDMAQESLRLRRGYQEIAELDEAKQALGTARATIEMLIAERDDARNERDALRCDPFVTVRYDLSSAQVEGKIREKLIAMGWTPPALVQEGPRRHVVAMARAILGQLAQPFPREEIDLDAVRAIATSLVEAMAAPRRVYLVATGETHNGDETYTRHDDAPPPLCDAECLYTAAQPAHEKDQPIGYISPKQVEHIRDPEGEFGAYIPMRKTPAGNFTLALFTSPRTSAQPAANLYDETDVMPKEGDQR